MKYHLSLYLQDMLGIGRTITVCGAVIAPQRGSGSASAFNCHATAHSNWVMPSHKEWRGAIPAMRKLGSIPQSRDQAAKLHKGGYNVA